jgi:hypothetical protein
LADNVAASTNRTINAGRPPDCKYSGKMSGVLGQKLGRKISRISVCDSSLRYSVSSYFELRQVK